ncbi:MAG: GNAT family N-acetyltransferase [Rhodobacteraceae bacterium]|nr:GNAT family N-acetyltransferase [Paracoccaceae bacterium]
MTSIPTLETERMILRAPVTDDQDGFAAFLMSERAVYAGGTQDKEKAIAEFQEMIDYWNTSALGTFTMERKDNGLAIGHVGGLKPEGWPEAELGWSIWRDEDEGKGFASEAAIAVLDYAFNHLGWKTAASYVAPDNKRSIEMTERLGARLDLDAAKPDGLTCLVYRHPAPEANQ